MIHIHNIKWGNPLSQESDISIQDLLNLFLQKNVVWGRSEATIEDYKIFCTRFIEHVGADKKASDIVESTFEDYFLHLSNTPTLCETSVKTYLTHIRSFLYFGRDSGYITPNFKVKIPSVAEKVKRVHTDNEVHLLTIKPDMKKCSMSELVNWVMVMWILTYGSRSGSIREIKIEHIDFVEKRVTIFNKKGKKYYYLPLPIEMELIIKEYLLHLGNYGDRYLFPSAYGNQHSKDSIKKSFARYCKKRMVNNTSLHSLRHYFAREYYLQTKDLYGLKEIMGHRDISTTITYIRSLVGELFEDYGQKIPLSRFIQQPKRIKMKSQAQ